MYGSFWERTLVFNTEYKYSNKILSKILTLKWSVLLTYLLWDICDGIAGQVKNDQILKTGNETWNFL